MKMIDHNHFICHLILGTFTEYPYLYKGDLLVPPDTMNVRVGARRFFYRNQSACRQFGGICQQLFSVVCKLT